MLKFALNKIIDKKDLTEVEMIQAVREIMDGKSEMSVMGGFLTALKLKGETSIEITGGAKVMREKAEKIDLDDLYTLDTCGTGGDNLGTFNISTASAFICAAAGSFVSKHGNRSVSSKSGSADVLEELGVNINLSSKEVEQCVRNENIGFLFAPNFHKAMKYAMPVRKQLGFRTIFNILGPLTNPVKAKSQVIGVFDERLTETMAEVLKNLGVKHALVVHGMDGLDEISVSGRTKVTELYKNVIKTYYISPEDFGLSKYDIGEILGGTAKDNAEIINRIFDGETGAKRDIVLLNSGAALYVNKDLNSIEEGINLAKDIIDSKKAKEKLKKFVAYTKTFS